MAMIPKHEIEAVRSQADIVDIVSRYIPIDRKGKEYAAICPFHEDHDPSMRISPDKQIYKCFVCGAGGNVFTFVQKMEKISFPESVLQVARMIGYPLNVSLNEIPRKQSPYEPVYRMLREFFDYASYELESVDGKAALDYLVSRKFSPEILKKFQIGYSPSFRQVQSYMQLKKMPVRDLARAGLVYVDEETGSFRPVFYNRIIIPIHDERGNPVGITARAMPGEKDTAKYINTTQTEVYEKGKLLFNYHRAREAARKNGRVIIAEGAMDVIGLAKAGIEEGVAALGTAFTPDQMQLLKKLSVPVVVFYDADAAGKKAAWKFGQAALQAGLRFSIVSQSDSKDPDEIFIAHGKEGLENALSRTVSYVDFAFDYLRSEYRLENYEDKTKYAEIMAGLIEKTMNAHEAPAAYGRLYELTGFDYSHSDQLQEQRRRYASGKKARKTGRIVREVPSAPVMESGRRKAEKYCLSCMLVSGQFADRFRDEIGYFQDENAQTLSLYIYSMYRKNEFSLESLMNDIEEDPVRNLLVELISEDPEISEEVFMDAILKIRESMLEDTIARLNQEIVGALDAAQRMDLIQKKQQLMQEKIELRMQERNEANV